MSEQVVVGVGTDVPAGAPADTALPATTEELVAELTKARMALKAANAESAERRKKLVVLEAAEAERAAAGQTDAQKLIAARQEIDALKAQFQVANLKAVVYNIATKLGFANPDDAYALLDISGVDASDVKAIEKALDELSKSGRLPVRGAQGMNNVALPGLQAQSRSTTSAAPVVAEPNFRL